MKKDREKVKMLVKRLRVNLSFTPYQLTQIDRKIKGTGESRASYVKRIFLTHERASNTFKSE